MSAAEQRVTRTGGRDATTRRIPPELALAVTMPTISAPKGWKWSALTDLARLESGHTPSRKHPEYWGGDIPWISLADAKINHGRMIRDTIENTNSTGIENSSARVLPAGTVCLSRTASVGYVVTMGRPMATSQDFVNWVCSKDLEPEFLKYLFVAEGDRLLRFASGAIHQTIYFPEAKAFHICHPLAREQRGIVAVLDEAFAKIAVARASAEKNLQNARELFRGWLRTVFATRPAGWLEQPMGHLATFRNGINFTTSSRGESVRVVGVKDFQHNFWAPLNDLDTATVDGSLPDADLLQKDDLLFVRSNGNKELIGRSVLVGDVTGRVTYSGFTIRARLKDGRVSARYLCHFLKSEGARQEMIAGGIGTNIKSLNQGILSGLVVPLPPAVDEQLRIADQIEEVGSEAQRLESIYQRKLAALDELKQSLLHEAFSGKL